MVREMGLFKPEVYERIRRHKELEIVAQRADVVSESVELRKQANAEKARIKEFDNVLRAIKNDKILRKTLKKCGYDVTLCHLKINVETIKKVFSDPECIPYKVKHDTFSTYNWAEAEKNLVRHDPIIKLTISRGSLVLNYEQYHWPTYESIYETRHYTPPSGIHPKDKGSYPPMMNHKPSLEQYIDADLKNHRGSPTRQAENQPSPQQLEYQYRNLYNSRVESEYIGRRLIRRAYFEGTETARIIELFGRFVVSRELYWYNIPRFSRVAKIFAGVTGDQVLNALENAIKSLIKS